MKTAVRLILAAFILGIIAQSSQAQSEIVTILHVNDSHSNLAPIGPKDAQLKGTLGGIARVASLVGMEKMANPNALFLHAGDVFIGDLVFNVFFGVPELQILHSLGLDAMAVGNHEFDLTPATLLMALDTAFVQGGFPLLSANLNLDDPMVQPLKKYISRYTIKQVGNLKVGIFGMTTPETNSLSQPLPAYIDDDLAAIAMEMVDTLKAKNCDVILMLSHLGLIYDGIIATFVPGINAIIGGHSHDTTPQPMPVQHFLSGDTTWIVQANAFYLYVGKLQLAVEGGKVSLHNYAITPIDTNIPEEPFIAGTVTSLTTQIEAAYQQPFYSQQVGFASAFFEEVADSLMEYGIRDTPVGNLVTDAFRSATGAPIAVEVGGSTAQPIYQGTIVPADLFRTVGYGFNTNNFLGYRMATFDILGAVLYATLDSMLSMIEFGDEYFPQVSGMSYSYDPQKQYNRLNYIKIGAKPLDMFTVYTIAANEFVPMFLDYLNVPYTNLRVFNDTTEFQALLSYVIARGTIAPYVEGRIIAEKSTDINTVAEIPASYALSQNYPNPVSKSTTISFSVPKTSSVKLSVHDLFGREVAVLLHDQVQPGMYSKRFDATGLPAGLYLYRLVSDGTNLTQKFIVTK